MTLENLLRTLHNYHKRHGLTILYNEPKTIWVRAFYCWLKISTCVLVAMFVLASLKTFTNNTATDRMLNLIGGIATVEIFFIEFFFWIRRAQVLELIDWCRKVEVQTYESFYKPRDWFYKKRQNVQFIVRLVAGNSVAVFILVTFVGAAVQTFLFNDGYRLIASFDFKNFSERDSLPIFVAESLILISGCWMIDSIIYLSFSIFILVLSYSIGQFELIQYFVKQLDLNNPKTLKNQLKEIVELHLDALRIIKKVSKLYLPTLKGKECDIYLYVGMMVFGKELSVALPVAVIGLVSIIGLYCYACDKMMEAEQNIRNAYYELDWYKAPVASRKLLLLAMQEPEQIRFGRVFSYDYASMERFLLLVRRAYDFSLILLKLSHK